VNTEQTRRRLYSILAFAATWLGLSVWWWWSGSRWPILILPVGFWILIAARLQSSTTLNEEDLAVGRPQPGGPEPGASRGSLALRPSSATCDVHWAPSQ
jgi:hypothetical protein